ncbi:threonylcarbamoyl-AMP synthase [archaeon]|jgi:tRNA threonylcarbamoyl adenosine modification protein (Sua5/YciO/YrdC/YwlC family)|nr:threonylcarbamoyl-AMP synthase [archaeon]
MVKILNFKDIDSKEIIKAMKAGAIFIYPTDTIYGIGCNANNQDSVNKIRAIKGRDSDKPFSVIAPSKKWVYDNVVINNKNYIKKLPGPFTFIFNIKPRSPTKKINKGFGSLGVRIPDHPFTKLVQKAGIPFITTSVNFSSQMPVRLIKKIPNAILKKVDYVLDDGYLHRYPSTIINLMDETPTIIKRRM